jgi:hypothetical protein
MVERIATERAAQQAEDAGPDGHTCRLHGDAGDVLEDTTARAERLFARGQVIAADELADLYEDNSDWGAAPSSPQAMDHGPPLNPGAGSTRA